jgi:hypothetical protein
MQTERVSPLLCFIEKNPLLAVAAGISASATSFLEQVNVLIRVGTGLTGLGIAVMTLLLQLRKYRKGD